MSLILTVLAVFIVIVGSEWWWRRQNIHGEFSRKFIHITVGSFVAFWPNFLTWTQIELLSLAFLVIILLSQWLELFQAIHSVQRPTLGEVFFAAAVGATALLTHNKWIYMAALLQMSLADGFAAVIGTRFPGRHKYSIFGHAKSLAGTTTFFAVSVIILLAVSHWGGLGLQPAWIVTVSLLLCALENLAIVGSDNLLIPLAVTVLLLNS